MADIRKSLERALHSLEDGNIYSGDKVGRARNELSSVYETGLDQPIGDVVGRINKYVRNSEVYVASNTSKKSN